MNTFGILHFVNSVISFDCSLQLFKSVAGVKRPKNSAVMVFVQISQRFFQLNLSVQSHKWARPAYEQGALPTLSLLPGEVVIKVLPGDKIYQAMEIEQGFMRPAILHGFGTSAKQRLPSRLAELAQFGWLPLAAACLAQ